MCILAGLAVQFEIFQRFESGLQECSALSFIEMNWRTTFCSAFVRNQLKFAGAVPHDPCIERFRHFSKTRWLDES